MSVDAAELFSRPGSDTRQWLSYGLVVEGTDDRPPVMFDDDEGEPLAEGPRVMVTLQPSNITVPCRVASFIAGVQEGSWYPFQPRDEVVVLVPEGDERAGCVIVTRCNQELDTWPRVVAGMDATKNNFGFWRLRTPFVIETAASFLIRSALTTAQIGIDPNGQVILADGDQNHLVVGPDGVSLSNGAQDTFLQANFNDKSVTLSAGSTRLELTNDAALSQFFTNGQLRISAGGGGGTGHAVTAEQLTSILANLICTLAIAGAFNPLVYSPVTWAIPGTAVAALNTLLGGAFAGAAAPTPVGLLGAPGGNLSAIAAAMTALGSALANPLPAQDKTGYFPGVGRAALLL